SEARRSHDRAALVQLRERGVGIDDLPAPFDTVHCPYVDDVEGLLRAVAARVDAHGTPRAAPPVAASTLTLLQAGPANASAPAGQVLLSQPTAALVADLPELAVLDLGTHRFGELPRPEHLHQASAPGAPARFPPIVSLGSVSGLPRQTTTFVGRAADVTEVAE